MGKKKKSESFAPGTILIWVFILVGLVAVFLLANSSLFNVSDISVIGCSRFSAGEIVAASGISGEINILHVDEEAARTEIEKNPYLIVTDIRRVFPTGVEIYVEERVPTAQIHTANGWYVTDEKCVALSLNNAGDDQLITLENVSIHLPTFGSVISSDSDAKTEAACLVLAAARQSGLTEKIRSVDLADPDNISLRYGDDLTVKIGKAVTAGDKLAQLEAALDAVKDKLKPGCVLNMVTSGSYYLSENEK